MHKILDHLSFLRHGSAKLVTVILVAEIVGFYGMKTAEYVPTPPPLTQFQRAAGEWTTIGEHPLDPETQGFLRADDTLNRSYRGPAGNASLFVGFFKSQRGGVTPHSPKVCLPGAGWESEASGIIPVNVPGDRKPIPVNRYVVRRGGDRSLVLYWYASANYAVANEYMAKLYLMYDGVLHHRSDAAIFRVIIPITQGDQAAEQQAIEFIQSFYPPLKTQIWG